MMERSGLRAFWKSSNGIEGGGERKPEILKSWRVIRVTVFQVFRVPVFRRVIPLAASLSASLSAVHTAQG
ncbi:hypothetical protein SAMN05421754_100535 [Nitrosomonas sp. Nm58]|nr:hypothetical protein SAMN05421754_100535 [Nitrosomonas sp. Nm58]